jgi:hypothetical protein
MTMSAMNSPGLPGTLIPGGLGMQVKNDSCSTAHLEAIAEIGATVIRRGFYWYGIEQARGEYDFTDYDRLLADCDRLGLRLVGCLFGGNDLYEDRSPGGIRGPEARAGFAAFAAAAAQRYAGRGILWEIWNEPNVRTFWRREGDHNSWAFAEEYSALVTAAAPAIRAADPQAIILAGSVSNFWEPAFQWTGSCCHHGMLAAGIDGLSVHPYGVLRPEDFSAGYERMRQILAEHGHPDLPILNTERGFSVTKHYEGWSGGEESRAHLNQAWHVARQYLVDRMNGVNLSVWYEWGESSFGLGSGPTARPGLQAYRTLAVQLSGHRFVERLPLACELDYLLRFESESGAQKLVAWTAPPEDAAPDQAREHTVPLPAGFTVGAAVDIGGAELALSVEGGSTLLPLSGAPIYLTC